MCFLFGVDERVPCAGLLLFESIAAARKSGRRGCAFANGLETGDNELREVQKAVGVMVIDGIGRREGRVGASDNGVMVSKSLE